MKQVTIWETLDGRLLDTKELAEAHERGLPPEVIVAGRTVEEIANAIAGNDEVLGDALEAISRERINARRARGHYKRGTPERAPEPLSYVVGETKGEVLINAADPEVDGGWPVEAEAAE